MMIIKDKYLWLTVSLTVFVIAPLTYPGYFQTHTGFLPLWSVTNLKQNLTDFSWLPVLQPFHPWRSGGLAPYYLAALLPLSPLTGIKLVSAGGLGLGAVGLYLWLRSWLGAAGAMVAALIYTYAPFTLATLYVRGAWSEAFFWGWLPWALLAATFLVAQPRLPIGVIGVCFWLLLGLSQLGLSLGAYLFLAVMLFIFHRAEMVWPLVAAALGLAGAVGLTMMRVVHPLDPLNLAGHLLYPAQLLSPAWGYGLSVSGWADGMSFSLGLAALGFTVLSFTVWQGGPDRRPWFFWGVAALCCLLMFPWAGWVWSLPGLNQLVTYPWQLLGFANLGLAVMSGVTFWLEPKFERLPIFASLIIVILLATYPHLEPQFISPPLPTEPEAIYGANQLLLVNHAFVVENEAEGRPFEAIEPYLPLNAAPSLRPGDSFILQVTWQAITPSTEDYKIFGHVVDAQGGLITQIDVQPRGGERPTSTWRPGELITDQYIFTLPLDSPPPVQVWLGFYQAETLTRLPVLGDDEGRVKLDVE